MLADIFGPDLLIVAIVLVVLLFGGAAIPKLARNLGSAKNEFEKGIEEGKKTSASRHHGQRHHGQRHVRRRRQPEPGRGEVLRQLRPAFPIADGDRCTALRGRPPT